jgi:long-chain acyl-CoA synthetase
MSAQTPKDWVTRCIALRKPAATLADMLDLAMQISPDKVAIVFEGTEVTYHSFDAAANQVANGLISLGIRSGDRVCVQLENCPEFLYIYFGILRAGAVMVPANVMYKAEEMGHILSDSGARFVFVSSANSAYLPTIGADVPELEKIIEVGSEKLENSLNFKTWSAQQPEGRPEVVVRPGDFATIQYTSGTTGKPKGAVVSHANVMAAIDMLGSLPRYPIDKDTVTLLMLPLFHTFGLNLGVGLSFSYASTMVLERRFNAPKALSLVEQYSVNLFWGAPPMFYAFVNTPGLEYYNTSSLKNVMTGAAIMPPAIFEEFHRLTGIELSDGYGLSETSPIVTFNAAGAVNKVGSVGPAYPGLEVRIMDDHDEELGVNEIGEICVKGPVVFQGYWNNTDATKDAMRNGWFHTGDQGRMDEDGYLFIVGRKKDMIVVSGYNVYPVELENLLMKHGSVSDCAVIGVPDDYQGESVKAVIVLNPDKKVSSDQLDIFMRKHLAAFKCPKYYSFVDALPKTPAGKVLKRILRKQ